MTDETENKSKSLEDMTVEDHLDAIGKTRPKSLPIVREDEATIDQLWRAKKTPPEVRILSLAEIAELAEDEAEAENENAQGDEESDTDLTTEINTDTDTEDQ